MKKIGYIILFLLFSSFVVADLCPRDTELFTDLILNTGSTNAQYTVNLKGAASGWATVVPNAFTLGPSESKVIYTYVTPSKNAVPAEYDLGVVVTGESIQEYDHPVVVKNCYGASFSVGETSKKACPTEVVKYEFTLRNTGEYRSTYNLGVEGEIKDYVTLGERVVSLDAGKSKTIIAYVNVPMEVKEYSFNIVAVSDKVSESFLGKLEVLPCYSFDVGIEKNSYDFCERTIVDIPIKLRNDGTIKNSYDLSVTGVDWVRLDEEYVELVPGEEKIVVLSLGPDYGVSGDFGLHLEVVPNKGALKAVNDFGITVRKCSDVDVNIIEESGMICSGMSSSFGVSVHNTGELSKGFRLEYDAPGWVNFGGQDLEFELGAGDVQEFRLRVDPNADEGRGSFDVKLRVSATDESAVSAFSEDSISLNLVDVEECFLPSISTEDSSVDVYMDGTATVPFSVVNKGKTKAEYNVVVTGSASSFVQLSPASLVVEPGNTEVVYLYVAPVDVELGTYDVDVSVRLKDSTFLASDSIRLRITDVDPEVIKVGYWLRIKDWFRSLFSSDVEDSEGLGSDEGYELVGDEEADNEETNDKGEDETSSEDFYEGKWYHGLWDKVRLYKYYVIGGIILIILILIFFKSGGAKKTKDFFEEEVEEG